ncbi:MAG: hypothetical protein ABIQ86_12155 [Steroidobacteraceae bacterium]
MAKVVHAQIIRAPLPALLMLAMVGLTLAYVCAVEVAKKWFYRRVANANK